MRFRAGLTLVEIMAFIFVLGIISSAMIISPEMARQSAENEAQRVRAYIYRQIDRADRMHCNFGLDTGIMNNEHVIAIDWPGMANDDSSFKASYGCRYSDNFSGTNGGTYNAMHKQFNEGGTITITDSEGRSYYVIIAATEGRIRISDTHP